ncbi:MAG: protein kinase [Candidatus Obscuribacterales bacterium]
MEPTPCPTTSQIIGFLRGEVVEPLASVWREHFDGCPPCQVARQFILTDFSCLDPALQDGELGRLAQYRINQVLGEGGMGIVLRARDTVLERDVALKVIRSEYSRDESVKERFFREARAMAQLKSDNIITVHEIGEHNQTCFIAMELLLGSSLESYLEDIRRPALREILRISRETAQALAEAHGNGLIHRDVKPANIYLDGPDARVKLLDFGLARPLDIKVNLTGSGFIMGSPAYMSPEQAGADPVDERSDLFSLGCVIYEMITGIQVFGKETITATLLAVTNENPVSPGQHNHECPASLSDLVMHMLEKQASSRPGSALDVIEYLKAIEGRLAAGPDVRSAGSARRDLFDSGSVRLSSGRQASVYPGREAERRQVTVIACRCDLFESEEFLEDLSTHVRADILSDFKQVCQESIESWEGVIIQCNEERLLACLGYPVAFEDAAYRAVGAACDIAQGLKELDRKIRDEHGVQLDHRLAVHTGQAVLESDSDGGLSLVGEARSLCLAIKDGTESGQIACSENTLRVLKGRFDCRSLGRRSLKGARLPVEVFEITGPAEASGNQAISGPFPMTPMVGREREIGLLLDRWKRVCESQGQVVMLIGEAGFGKSRLVRALKENLVGEEAQLIEWQSSPNCRNTALYPAQSFFRRRFEIDVRDPAAAFASLVSHLDEGDSEPSGLIRSFASLLSVPLDERFTVPVLPPVREREEIFHAIREWLLVRSGEQPLLFVVEDIHWLDASTLDFLARLQGEIGSTRILLVLTLRPDFAVPWPVRANQTSFSLDRLSRSEVGEMITHRSGREMSAAVVDQVMERSDGVPLFVEEFTEMLDQSGMLSPTADTAARVSTLMTREIPLTLQDLIMARLDRSVTDRTIALLAAAIGREFSLDLLSAVSDLDKRILEDELAKLVQADILYKRGRPSIYAFKHALLVDALYNSLVKAKREAYHGRIASALLEKSPDAGADQPELIAHHLTLAGRKEDAIEYWLAAARISQERFANVEAIEHLTSGLKALEALPESRQRDDLELETLTRLGMAYQSARGYAAPEVGVTFKRARSLCERTGSPEQLFEVVWGNWTWHLVRGELELCADLADDMMSLAKYGNDPGMLMEAMVGLVAGSFFRGHFAECLRACEQALNDYEDLERCRFWARRLGQNSAVVIRCYRSLALWHLGYPERAIAACEEMLDLAREIAHPFSLSHGLYFASMLFLNCRLGDRLSETAEYLHTLAEDQGFELWIATAAYYRGAVRYLGGRAKEAVFELMSGIAAFRSLGAELTVPAQLALTAEASFACGEAGRASEAIRNGLELCEKNDNRVHEAELHRLSGELQIETSEKEAEAKFFKALEVARAQEDRSWELRAASSLARLMKRQGRGDDGRNLLDSVYGSFDEGFDLPDLKAARLLLDSI